MQRDALGDLRPPGGGPENLSSQQHLGRLVEVVSDHAIADMAQLVLRHGFQQAVRYLDTEFGQLVRHRIDVGPVALGLMMAAVENAFFL